MKKIAKKLIMTAVLFSTFGLISQVNDNDVVKAETTTKKVYLDVNESGREWILAHDSSNNKDFDLRYHYYGGASSNGFPGDKVDFTKSISKWGREIYYVEIPSDSTGFILSRTPTDEETNPWSRWNVGPESTYCLANGYNFYQPSWDGTWKEEYGFGTESWGLDYAAQSLYVVTLHNGESTSEEYYITNWESNFSPATLQDTEDFMFCGWYEDEEFTTPYVARALTEDLNLYAKWEEIPEQVVLYTVKVDNGTTINEYEVRENGTLTLETPSKQGYDFEGWVLSDGSEFVSGYTQVTGNIEVNAIFKLNNVKIETRRIFIKQNSWYTVNAYYWNENSSNTWPGTAMNYAGDELYYIDIDLSYTSIIFNNGNSGEQNQTEDLTLTEANYYDITTKTWSTYGNTTLKLGYQVGQTNENLSSFRLIGFIYTELNIKENVKEFAFNIRVNYEETKVTTDKYKLTLNTNEETVSTSDYSCAAFYTYTFNDVEVGTTYYVTPTVELVTGEVVYGTTYVVDVIGL